MHDKGFVRKNLPAAGLALMFACSLSIAGCGLPITGLAPGHEDSVQLQDYGVVSLTFRDSYQALATKADIKQIRCTLSGGSLSTPSVQTVAYPTGGNLSFTNIKEGSYSLKIEALNASGASIGTVTKDGVQVIAGQLTTVSVALKLTPTNVDQGNGNVGVGIIIEDGDIVTTPLPTPSPSPTPTPAPTPGGSLVGNYYVDDNAASGGSGTSSAPFQTIAAAVSRASSGQTIVVRSGTYRESLTINKSIKLLAESGAVIKGSDVWSGWTQEGAYWTKPYSLNWPQKTGGSSSERSKLADQVFINGAAQVQETSLDNVGAGEFYVGNGKLYLGTDPSGKTVEVTSRAYWLKGSNGASNVTVKGFTMTHAAALAQAGGLSDEGGASWLIENNDLSYAHGAGVQIGGLRAVLRNNRIHHNGQIGIVTGWRSGMTPDDQLIEGNEISHNNTEGFSTGWESGGTKFVRTKRQIVKNNEVHHNEGAGLWWDVDNDGPQILGNRIHHNTREGIKYEVSKNAVIDGNKVWENSRLVTGWVWGAGINIQSSLGCEVSNNVVAWNGDGIGLVEQSREVDYSVVTGHYVHDNVVAGKEGALLGWVSDKTDKTMFASNSNNRGANNRYYNGGSANWEWNGVKRTISDFNATPGEEGGRMLTSSELSSILGGAGIPTAPEAI